MIVLIYSYIEKILHTNKKETKKKSETKKW